MLHNIGGGVCRFVTKCYKGGRGVKKCQKKCYIIFEWPHIDRFHTQRILTDLNLEHLQEDYVWSDRLGKKDGSKIRPIRIEFGNNWVREKVISRSWMLKYSVRYSGSEYPDGVFLTRDLTKEDRATEKAKYLLRKQQKNTTGGNPDNTASTTAAAANMGVQGNSLAAGAGDQTHPHGVGEVEGT